MDKPEEEITTFLHCSDCIDELPEGKSPQDNVYLECGLTENGFAVWCVRHKQLVMLLTPISLKGLLAARDDGGLKVNAIVPRDDVEFMQ